MAPLAIGPAAASQELLARRRGRESLLEFTKQTHPSFMENWHHKIICSALERVERGEIDRLMIFMPPRSGKSEIVSLRLPAWYLGRHPERQILSASYNDDLATHFGRQVRNVVNSAAYRRFFPDVKLAHDSRASNTWSTNKGGEYLSAGMQAGMTGHGAHIAIIDDPFKNRQEADSQLVRDRVWSIFESDIQSRLMPGGAIVVMHTRWHEDDLAGRLREKMDSGAGDAWEIIEFPAILNEGTGNEKALFEDWFPLKEMRRRRKNTDKRTWSALYQQNPQPDSGDYFERDWFRRYRVGEYPEHVNKYMASDFAVTTEDEGGKDFTEHGVWGLDADDNLWALDWWFGQTPPDVWIESLLNLARTHHPMLWGAESGPIRRSIEPMLKRRMRERGIYIRAEYTHPATDKPSRARSFQARASMGKVFIPHCEWGDRLLDHLLRFPTSKLDHSVDVCATIGQMMERMNSGQGDSAPEEMKVDRWSKRFDSTGDYSDTDRPSWKVM